MAPYGPSRPLTGAPRRHVPAARADRSRRAGRGAVGCRGGDDVGGGSGGRRNLGWRTRIAARGCCGRGRSAARWALPVCARAAARAMLAFIPRRLRCLPRGMRPAARGGPYMDMCTCTRTCAHTRTRTRHMHGTHTLHVHRCAPGCLRRACCQHPRSSPRACVRRKCSRAYRPRGVT